MPTTSIIPAAIGGAVAGVAVLMIIIAVGCIYKRKKSNVEGKQLFNKNTFFCNRNAHTKG